MATTGARRERHTLATWKEVIQVLLARAGRHGGAQGRHRQKTRKLRLMRRRRRCKNQREATLAGPKRENAKAKAKARANEGVKNGS